MATKWFNSLDTNSNIQSKVRGRFRKILWPSQNVWTLPLGIIECGSACAAQFDGGCDLYAPKKDSKLCHIGYFDNTETNYLTGESEINPVYINLSKYRLIIFRSTHYFANSANIWQLIFCWIAHVFTNFSINCFKFKT